jgi:hypothetical protein
MQLRTKSSRFTSCEQRDRPSADGRASFMSARGHVHNGTSEHLRAVMSSSAQSRPPKYVFTYLPVHSIRVHYLIASIPSRRHQTAHKPKPLTARW